MEARRVNFLKHYIEFRIEMPQKKAIKAEGGAREKQ